MTSVSWVPATRSPSPWPTLWTPSPIDGVFLPTLQVHYLGWESSSVEGDETPTYQPGTAAPDQRRFWSLGINHRWHLGIDQGHARLRPPGSFCASSRHARDRMNRARTWYRVQGIAGQIAFAGRRRPSATTRTNRNRPRCFRTIHETSLLGARRLGGGAHRPGRRRNVDGTRYGLHKHQQREVFPHEVEKVHLRDTT